MKKISLDEIDELANALQLSIKTPIDVIVDTGASIEIVFSEKPRNDDHLDLFLKMFSGDWNEKGDSYTFHGINNVDWSKITYFLLTTRLKLENIKKLAEIDPSIRGIVQNLEIKVESSLLQSSMDASRIIFSKVKETQMTIRELSQKTGLSQVTISKFKAGNDVRLSSLVKIVQALGLHISIR